MAKQVRTTVLTESVADSLLIEFVGVAEGVSASDLEISTSGEEHKRASLRADGTIT